MLLGKPSTKNFLLPLSCMAFFNSSTVILAGTILPSLMYVLISSAVSLPLAFSALSRSPALKCT